MKFLDLIKYFERLEATTKRLEMFDILAELFREAEAKDIDKIIYLSQGQLVPSFKGLEIGMSEKLLMRAIADAAKIDVKDVEKDFKKAGDLGRTAEGLIKGKGKGFTITEVYSHFYKIAETSGEGSVEKKIGILRDLLSSVSPLEAKYVSRFVIGRLRLGVGDASALEALSLAKLGSREYREYLERAYNLCSDLGLVARTLFEKGEKGIKEIKVQVGYPIRMALCERLSSAEEIIEKVGKCAVEAKYDGFRCQVHKDGEQVEIFSRNLERTTLMFPEIVDAARVQLKAKRVIFEGEALAYNEATGELFPFQVTIQRKRKHGIEEIAKEYPLKIFVFDLLYADGIDYTSMPYKERRERLAGLIKKNTTIELSNTIITDNPKTIARFFEEAVEKGLEGMIAKRLDAPYSAGARNFNWIKLKRSYKGELQDTVDVCIIGYFKGRGQRARFGIGAVLGALYDPKTDTFKTVSKVGSGFSEEEWERLRQMLDEVSVSHKPARVESLIEPDVWIQPVYVVTITADEITRSPSHTAGMKEGVGYALRFPRAQGFIREDKKAEDANTVDEILEMYGAQKHVKLAG